jgi:hypothetical protein
LTRINARQRENGLRFLSVFFAFIRVHLRTDSSAPRIENHPRSNSPIYQHGNILIDAGRLRIGSEALPLANIVGASRMRIGRPKRHWGTIVIVAGIVLLAGVRFSTERWGLGLIAAGALAGLWAWFFHRRKAWVVQLHLLLNQRIQIQFENVEDAEAFLAALAQAKGGDLPVRRSS